MRNAKRATRSGCFRSAAAANSPLWGFGCRKSRQALRHAVVQEILAVRPDDLRRENDVAVALEERTRRDAGFHIQQLDGLSSRFAFQRRKKRARHSDALPFGMDIGHV